MRSIDRRSVLAAFIVVLGAVWVAAPAYAVEDGLFGVRIGASYRELTEKFGPPHGIVFPSMVFQTVAPSAVAGLPSFGQAAVAETPIWVQPIRPASMEGTQTEWVYNFAKARGIALGIVLTGEGADAVVSDVIVAGFPQNLKGKSAPVRTAKGIELQSTFEDILKKYGYPPLIEIYPPTGGGGGAGRVTAGGAMRAGGRMGGAMRAGGGGRGGMRGGGRRGGGGGRGAGMRGGGMGGRRGGRGRGMAAAPGVGDMTAGSGFQVVLTGGRRGGGMRGGGRRGGGMRGGMGGGGMRGGMRGGGRGGARGGGRGRAGALPPLGAAPAAGAADQYTATAVVNHQAVSFSRDCTLVYEGIAFTLHDMKLFRIHVSE